MKAAGLMVDAKVKGGTGWYTPQVFLMALTKRGRVRAEEIRYQRMTQRQWRWERRIYHATLSKQPPLHRTRWRAHPARFSVLG